MNSIEEIKQIIDNYINEKKFLNVKDFFHFAKCLIFITYKGTGKSYSAMKACIDELKKGVLLDDGKTLPAKISGAVPVASETLP